jgi:glycosyltransferase involved in cell wall biosynthesis
MRVLWLSPGLRFTARMYAESLQALGVEVILVTASLHPEYRAPERPPPDPPREYEVELLGRPVPTAGWRPFLAAYRLAARFQPDVVVTELLRDPRWRTFARLAPRVRLVHDDKPHDPTHEPPWWNRWFFDRWDDEADATVVFSNYAAQSLRAAGWARSPMYLAPLISDLDAALVPDFVDAQRRRNFVLIGRQRPYKNHDVVFAAWDAHARGSAWRGDELVLFGAGEISPPLPPHARWYRGSYRYRQVVAELAASKGSIVHCRRASQSGVQVLSMQLGVPTLVSTAGALPEYQPPGLSITGIDDVDGLSQAIDALADPVEVEVQARVALEHHRTHYDPAIAAGRLVEIFRDVVSHAHGG